MVPDQDCLGYQNSECFGTGSAHVLVPDHMVPSGAILDYPQIKLLEIYNIKHLQSNSLKKIKQTCFKSSITSFGHDIAIRHVFWEGIVQYRFIVETKRLRWMVR